ncbi:MAG: GAF domain-containing protein [Bryobacterales bacterium]|nr:GAF domain-containing protein [Bryobacterales bacterium]
MVIRTSNLISLLLLAIPLAGQVSLSLREAAARNPSTLLPEYEGSSVILQGTVTLKPILFGDYSQVPIRDSRGGRLILEAPDFMFEHVTPGDELQVRGVITHRGGLPVLRMVELTTLNHTKPPPPFSRQIHQLQSVSELGVTALIEGRVVALGEDSGGEYLLLDDGQPVPYPVYLSRAASRIGTGLGRYQVGDRVRVVGAASQANINPPFEAKFRMVIPDAASVILLGREWLVSPQIVLSSVLSFGSFLVLVLVRRWRRQAARRAIRRIHGLCEELLTISAFEELVRKLRHAVPRALEVTSVELYRFDRLTQSLCGCVAEPAPGPIPLSAPKEDGKSIPSIALCFRNRTPLRIPGASSSSLLPKPNTSGVILLPMFAREELVGVLEIAHTDRPRHFSMEELVALQHLANQVAMVMKLLEMQARKEQMMRSQRLAATGQIISGVAGELKGPLESILILAHKLLDQGDEARAILNESLRASAILSRYSQVIRQDEGEAAPLELNALLHKVIDSCRKDFSHSEIAVTTSLWGEPLWIVGSARQLEHVLRNLVLLAARAARPSLDHSLRFESSLQQRRVVITIRYGALLCDEYFPAVPNAGENESLGFSVCRGILHSLGGDVRILQAGENACRMEIDLPAAFHVHSAETAVQAKAAHNSRTLTAIILEPDSAAQRRLVSFWTSRSHRAVPISTEAEAVELFRRLKIDIIFCAVRLPGSNWVEFFDRVRDQVPAFVLLTDGVDSDASTLFPQGEGFVLRKPMEAGEMDRLLERLEQHIESTAMA